MELTPEERSDVLRAEANSAPMLAGQRFTRRPGEDRLNAIAGVIEKIVLNRPVSVKITKGMVEAARYEMGNASPEEAWRTLACALRAGGYGVIESE